MIPDLVVGASANADDQTVEQLLIIARGELPVNHDKEEVAVVLTCLPESIGPFQS
jgi:hypothetical protein